MRSPDGRCVMGRLHATAVAVALVVVGLSAAACGGSVAAPVASSPAAASVTPANGTAAPLAAASPTQSPAAPTPAPPSPGPSFVPPTVATFAPASGTPSATWDLVALGDSNVSGWGVRDDQPFSPQAAFPGVYAGLLADQQGVAVTLHSYYPDQLGNEVRTVAEWVDVVRADPSMRADLAAAEVVVLLIGYHDMIPALMLGSCPPDWPALRDCLDKATAPMPAAFDALDGEVRGLVPSDATVLVADYGIPGPVYDTWSAEPYWPEFRQAAFEGWRDALEAAAVRHGFTVVHMYAAVNDANGKPRWNWDEVTSDGWHYNAEGHRRIAGIVLAQDGFPD